jgi:hypothetical protein
MSDLLEEVVETHGGLHTGRGDHAADRTPDLRADAGRPGTSESLLVSIDLSEITFA